MKNLMRFVFFLCIGCSLTSLIFAQKFNGTDQGKLIVRHTQDFTITGNGSANEWSNTSWHVIPQRAPGLLRNNGWRLPEEEPVQKDVFYQTNLKILYSDNGIYCLYKCEDSVITATIKEDYGALYNEDVVEAFFRPDTSLPLYLEYELSPLNYELPILIINKNGNTMGWKPWRTEGPNKIIHAVKINEKNSATGRFTWTAEFFIPFRLLVPMENVPPSKGTKWKANFYRIDYDLHPVYSSWQLTRRNYHDYERFGTIEFE